MEDSGSHPDLSLPLMERSIALVGAYFGEVTASLAAGEPLACQLDAGRRAERRMLAQLGTNTHKGAIFLGGVLLVALHRAPSDEASAVRAEVRSVARELTTLSVPRGTHGEAARARFEVGGILGEVRTGLPSVFDVAVPVFRAAAARGESGTDASFRMLARLMQTVEDTTTLHRCGRAGLAQLREDGVRLQPLIALGTHIPFLRERNALYRCMGLTMGGVADLLGSALAWLAYRGELPAAATSDEATR